MMRLVLFLILQAILGLSMVNPSLSFPDQSTTAQRQKQQLQHSHASNNPSSLSDRPMPMHRHFMLQRQLLKKKQAEQRQEQKSSSDTNFANTNNRKLKNHKHSKNLRSNDDPDTTNKKDPLTSSWWFRLEEGKKIPDTRRAHHSVIYSINQNHSDDTDAGSDTGTDAEEESKSDTMNDDAPQNKEEEPNDLPQQSESQSPTISVISNSPTATASSNGPTTKFVDSSSASPSSHPSSNVQTLIEPMPDVDSNATLQKPTNPNNHTRNLSISNPYQPSTQEYMIISGGFTDFDWVTFPVWAYDINAATIGSKGQWYEILTTEQSSYTSSTYDATPPHSKKDSKKNGNWEHYDEVYDIDDNFHVNMYDDDDSKKNFQDNAACYNLSDLTVIHDSDNTHDIWRETAMLCSPPSRVGHLSVMRGEYLYVFGGSLYNDKEGVFFMEEMPFMYRLHIPSDYFQNPKAYDSLTWERILPSIVPPPPYMNGGTVGTEYNNRPEDMVNRGEVRGGYWEKEDKMIIYGGLHVRDYETSYGREQQADETLGDVWCYDFKTDTWEMMAPSWAITGDIYTSVHDDHFRDHPGKRTSHGATVVGDELIVYGGLRKVETYFFDGSTVWDQLDDVWVFNLRTLQWKERVMKETMGRAYHSVVGWESEDRKGTVMATFGGYRIQTDPVDNEEIDYVYDDTMITFPPQLDSQNETMSSIWFLATYEGMQTTISTRLEHTSVLSKEFGTMIVWGGRYKGTSEVEGMWSLNVNGGDSNVLYMVRNDDDTSQNIGVAYIVLVSVMLMSMMFTYMCGILHRRIENEQGGGNVTMEQVMDPNNGFSFARRNGLPQEIIDTLPLKIYEPGLEKKAPQNRTKSQSEEEGEIDEDIDENCCPICLVEYEEGDEIRCLPCGHEFHKSCVDSWLANNASCPSCRHSLQDLANLTTSSSTAIDNNESNQEIISVTSSRRRVPTLMLLRTLVSRVRMRQHSQTPNEIVSAASNESNGSIPNVRSATSSNSTGSIGDLDLELSYTSSLEEIDDNLPTNEQNNRRRNRRFRPILSDEEGEMPVSGRTRRIRVSASERRRTRRLAERRSRGARSPLNDPLQPASGSMA